MPAAVPPAAGPRSASAQDDDGGSDRGSVWLVFMRPDGSAKLTFKISDTVGGFTGSLDDADQFGSYCAVLPDTNKDGVAQMAVGAIGDDDSVNGAGAVWVMDIEATVITGVSSAAWELYD